MGMKLTPTYISWYGTGTLRTLANTFLAPVFPLQDARLHSRNNRQLEAWIVCVIFSSFPAEVTTLQVGWKFWKVFNNKDSDFSFESVTVKWLCPSLPALTSFVLGGEPSSKYLIK